MHHKPKNKRLITIAILLLLISVGFAYLTATLEIDGLAGVKGNTWKIYFDNVEIYKGASLATTAPTTTGTNTTDLDYSITLTKPGDVYKFYVDIVNESSLDAMVHLVKKTNLTAEQKKYINYTVTYADETPIEPLNLLAKKNGNNPTIDTIVVTIEYKKDVAEEDLPTTTDVSLNQKIHLDYRQANSSASARATTQPTITYDWNYNMIRNGDFEDGLDYWETTHDDVPMDIDNTRTYNGKPSLHVISDTNNWSGVKNNSIYLSPNNIKIRACFYKESNSTDGDITQPLRFYYAYTDESSERIYKGFGTTAANELNNKLVDTEWVCVEKEDQLLGTFDSPTLRVDNGQNGTINNYWLADVQVKVNNKVRYTYNTAITTLPTTPTREGYTFDGWYTDPYGGTQVTTALVVRESQTLYAHWSQN